MNTQGDQGGSVPVAMWGSERADGVGQMGAGKDGERRGRGFGEAARGLAGVVSEGGWMIARWMPLRTAMAAISISPDTSAGHGAWAI